MIAEQVLAGMPAAVDLDGDLANSPARSAMARGRQAGTDKPSGAAADARAALYIFTSGVSFDVSPVLGSD